MEYGADERAYLWLCACTTTEYRERVALLRSAPSPAALMAAPEKYFPAARAETYDARPEERERRIDAFLRSLAEKGCFAVTLLSDDYPEPLKHISAPPLVLYGRGRRELLAMRKFTVVGSRITPPWAEKLGQTVSRAISERMAVVTGLAEGGDSAAIAGALETGNIICVLPCGLERCYPAAHATLKAKVAARGLLLSELLPEEDAKKYSFHARNRILAGLSEGVLVLSAAAKSGALITANDALEFGRDVFAFPYNVGSTQGEGCNDLIKKGAYLTTSAADILSAYGMEEAEKETVNLTPGEESVLKVLRDYGELHAAVIAEKVGMSAFEALAMLSSLELKGLAVKSGGNKYSAV